MCVLCARASRDARDHVTAHSSSSMGQVEWWSLGQYSCLKIEKTFKIYIESTITCGASYVQCQQWRESPQKRAKKTKGNAGTCGGAFPRSQKQ